jgi:CDP-diacylglycerol--serine O-phosphatidyltransferase
VLVLFVALLIAYPWIILASGTLAYLVILPFGWLSYRGYVRRSREGKTEPAAATATAAVVPPPPPTGAARKEERPSRLN